MMNRHFIFALCTVLGFSVSGISMAQSVPTDKEAAAKAAKAAKVKFRWGKSLKSAQKQAGGNRPSHCSSFHGNVLVRLLC